MFAFLICLLLSLDLLRSRLHIRGACQPTEDRRRDHRKIYKRFAIDSLKEAVTVSPSLGKRERPHCSKVTEEEWKEVTRPKCFWSTPNDGGKQSNTQSNTVDRSDELNESACDSHWNWNYDATSGIAQSTPAHQRT